MKTIHLSFVILIQLVLAGSLMSQTSITLTFTANTAGQHQALDSVVVENLTQGGDTVLHYPDTILVLDHGTGVFDPNGNHNEGLFLYPSFPNPFTGHTTSRLFLPERDVVTIRIFDLLSREVAVYQQTLPAGEHTFTLYPGSERQYLLVVENSRDKRVQKLISMGGGGAFRIEHSGSQQHFSGFKKGKSGIPWSPGDQLQFTGYATLTGNVLVSDTISDDPVASSFYTFHFTGSPGNPCAGVTPPAGYGIVSSSGKCWLDRNLGATQVATSSTDASAYGDLYQWGRGTDGHQVRTSNTTTTLSSNDQPGHGNFIVGMGNPYDWRNPPNANLWQGVNGVNNPCPSGWRVPTEAEWEAERLSWSSSNAAGAFASPLKLPLAGFRSYSNGSLFFVGSYGVYWSSTVSGTGSRVLSFSSTDAGMLSYYRADGSSVRCLKDSIGSSATLPNVSTDSVSSITSTSAVTGGNVTSDGGAAVTARGVCWSTSPNPTTADNATNDGTGTGSFTSNITGLNPSTTYYVRAYATNSAGTAYGAEINFTTLSSTATPPTVTTTSATSITQNSATSGGNVTSQGSTAVTARGVCWSTSPNPTISNSTTSNGTGTGSFTSNITGLNPATTYYVRAYATNSAGTAYGNEVSFSTTSVGNACAGVTAPAGYGIVSSSGKCWLDRNLGASQVATSSTDASAYGDLYQWGRGTDGHQVRTSSTTTTLSSSDQPGHGNFILAPSSPYDWRTPQNTNLWQGVNGVNNPCPTGWRVPTEAEWEAERLSWSSSNAAGAFASPLKLPLAGYRDDIDGSLYHVGSGGRYWSNAISGHASRYLYIISTTAYMYGSIRAIGNSVRCLKD